MGTALARRDGRDRRADTGCTDPDEADGRMVALVNHPIWPALGDGAGGYDDSLGNPWAPFAFNSGRGTEAVPRDECVELGIMGADDVVTPDRSIDINEGLEASVAKFDQAMQDALAGGGLRSSGAFSRLRPEMGACGERAEERQAPAPTLRRSSACLPGRGPSRGGLALMKITTIRKLYTRSCCAAAIRPSATIGVGKTNLWIFTAPASTPR